MPAWVAVIGEDGVQNVASYVEHLAGRQVDAATVDAVVAVLLILVYVAWRFWPNWIVAVASIISTVHDVGIVLGILALVGAQFSIPVLAAILFVIGYSLNDSIIISDRIRENLRVYKGTGYRELVDLSVNQTLSRTLMTSLTTLLPVLALFFFGGSVLRDFSLVLMVGILFGTYSSIFILAPMVVWFQNRQNRRGGNPSGEVRPAKGVRVVLPVDVVVAKEVTRGTEYKTILAEKVPASWHIVDLAQASQELILESLTDVQTVFWNVVYALADAWGWTAADQLVHARQQLRQLLLHEGAAAAAHGNPK